MKVCVQCQKEMICDKNGVGANFGLGHVYSGDRFKCLVCGMMILVCNSAPNYDPDLSKQYEYLNMVLYPKNKGGGR